jgi:hypothetical protein
MRDKLESISINDYCEFLRASSKIRVTSSDRMTIFIKSCRSPGGLSHLLTAKARVRFQVLSQIGVPLQVIPATVRTRLSHLREATDPTSQYVIPTSVLSWSFTSELVIGWAQSKEVNFY